MPTIHWIGKEKIVNHHLDIPYHTLDLQYTFDASNTPLGDGGNNPANHSNPINHGSDNTRNKIIHADNLLAL